MKGRSEEAKQLHTAGKQPLKPVDSDGGSENGDGNDDDFFGEQGQGQDGRGQDGRSEFALFLEKSNRGASSASANAAGNRTIRVVLVVKRADALGLVVYMSDGSDTYTYFKIEARKRLDQLTSHEAGQLVAKLTKRAGLLQRKVNRSENGWKDWHMKDMDHYELSIRELKDMYESGGKMWFEINGSPPCVDPEKKDKFESDMQALIPGFSLDQIHVKDLESD